VKSLPIKKHSLCSRRIIRSFPALYTLHWFPRFSGTWRPPVMLRDGGPGPPQGHVFPFQALDGLKCTLSFGHLAATSKNMVRWRSVNRTITCRLACLYSGSVSISKAIGIFAFMYILIYTLGFNNNKNDIHIHFFHVYWYFGRKSHNAQLPYLYSAVRRLIPIVISQYWR
jgi:hypothetical protein